MLTDWHQRHYSLVLACMCWIALVGASGCGDDDDPEPLGSNVCDAVEVKLGGCGLRSLGPGGICGLEMGECIAGCFMQASCEELQEGTWELDTLLCLMDCEPRVECPDGSNEINESWTCDFEEDCLDGSDEVDCVHHLCSDGTPVPDAYLCDGDWDCTDGSDEWQC